MSPNIEQRPFETAAKRDTRPEAMAQGQKMKLTYLTISGIE
jgi:hypothetical protein